MELVVGLIGGFLLGILASGIAWLITEYATRPSLDIVVDQNRAQGQSPGNPPHEFYHVRVRNLPATRPLPGRRPAWACTARIDVFRQNGSRVITREVIARWTSQPEPLLPVIAQGQVGNVLDPARLMQARRMDVHSHSEEPVSVAVKFEGEPDCYIFTNESYVFPRWQNPSWRIPPGQYRLRVTIYYERGRAERDFELSNAGPRRDDVQLKPMRAEAKKMDLLSRYKVFKRCRDFLKTTKTEVTYTRRIWRGLVFFLGPYLAVSLVAYVLARAIGTELAPPIDPTGTDYRTILLAGTGILAALASVEVQMLHTLRLLRKEYNENEIFDAPCDFTALAAWWFADCIPPTLILVVLDLAGWSIFGLQTITAALQYVVFILFVFGWLFLFAGSLSKKTVKWGA